MKSIIHISILILTFAMNAFSQNESGIVMTSFIPKSKAYDIYYPKNLLLEEDEDIVTISDTTTGLNITISTYPNREKSSDINIIELLNGFLEDYFKKEIDQKDWKSYKSKFDNLVELKLTHETTNWIWWGVVNKSRMVIISLNKEETITIEDVHLVQYMINNLVINQ